MADFQQKDWTTEFGLVSGEEILPPHAPEPRGIRFVIRAKVDADHGGDSVTRQLKTNFIVYLNLSPVYWLSKKQASVESPSFGIAMK